MSAFDCADRDSALSRRTILRTTGLAVGATAGLTLPATASAQQTDDDSIISPGVVPSLEQWGTDISGFFIHVGGPIDPVEAQVSDQCAFADWSPEQTVQYDSTLINRIDDAHASVELPLYVPDRVPINPGTLFVVNRVHQCESGYVGIELERIGADFVVSDEQLSAGQQAQDGNTSSGFGDGFGLLSALAGLTGGSALLRRHRQ
ncbi:hypothetical protein VB773_22855 [Haloarculaceae archaeon H-GB2-1]|nr:hypothetical protein [Haloarculaceae archaeon H-GB1-1]MEA5389600.1 hypothetical protein [Haloarculaceae archaeon H-GB11]MEA5410135.1 hypothetical protein [Haloarculaceae archaeon H-GB2-1]